MAISELDVSAEDIKLVISLHNKRDVELLDLTKSFLSLAEFYKGYIERKGLVEDGNELKLYVREIRSGSITAELVSVAAQMQVFIGGVIPLLQFTQDLKLLYEYFLGGAGKDPGLSKRDYERSRDFLQPVARDPGAQITMTIEHLNGDVVLNVPPLNSTESNAIQNRINNHIAKIQAAETGIYSEMLFYWKQARDDHSGVGDRGMIESISARPVKVRFKDERTKEEMLKSAFERCFVVDVDVQTVEGKPQLYTILTLHESFLKEG